jgi:hypothetical protein
MAKDLTQALHDLTQQAQGQTSRRDEKLPAAKPVSAIPARSGVGTPSGGGGGSGSIAGPLTETSFASRVLWAERNVPTTDGLLVFKLRPIRTVNFVDGASSPLAVNYADPT